MIDATDLVSLEAAVRALIGEEVAALWTSAGVQRAINSEVAHLVRKVVSADAGYFETTITPTLAASVSLPPNCYAVRNVELSLDGVWVSPRWIGVHDRGKYQALSGASDFPSAVRFSHNSLVFESGVGSASSLRVTYARVPAAMRTGTVAGAAAASFTLDSGASVYDDVYVGDTFAILSGTGAGQYAVAADYVGSTKVVTVPAWGTPPDTDSTFSTLLPGPLAKWPDIVALGAAVRLLVRRRDGEMMRALSERYSQDEADVMAALEQRQTEQPSRGNFISNGGDE